MIEFIKRRRTKKNNKQVASEIGFLLVQRYANDRQFRRTLKQKYPNFVAALDSLVSRVIISEKVTKKHK